MAFADIQGALMQAVQNCGLDYPTAWEGRDFAPPENAPWLQTFVLPVSSQAASLGIDALTKHIGILQIDINYPRNQGTGGILADADTIAAFFKRGSALDYNNISLQVQRCERSQIRSNDAWQKLSLSVRWCGWASDES